MSYFVVSISNDGGAPEQAYRKMQSAGACPEAPFAGEYRVSWGKTKRVIDVDGILTWSYPLEIRNEIYGWNCISNDVLIVCGVPYGSLAIRFLC